MPDPEEMPEFAAVDDDAPEDADAWVPSTEPEPMNDPVPEESTEDAPDG